MARSPADLAALKAELTNDPMSLGLVAPPAIADVENAAALNIVRDTLQVDREAIPVSEIFLQIDRDEYAALPAADRDWLNGVTAGGTINPKAGGEVREGILQLFGAASESRANLMAIMTESANRVEHMFKLGLLEQGGSVTSSDVADARQVV